MSLRATAVVGIRGRLRGTEGQYRADLLSRATVMDDESSSLSWPTLDNTTVPWYSKYMIAPGGVMVATQS